MFERFTDRARGTVVMAQEEARRLSHNYIGTEHVLLGLLREQEGVAARALSALGVSLEDVRQQVTEIIGRGEGTSKGHIPFTPRAKKVLELSLREALQLKHNYIGTEHILLGLIREGEGVAAQVLVRLGAELSGVRKQVMVVLGETPPEPGEEPRMTGRRRTPAAEQILASAEELAGGSPVGSHHLLEALARAEGSAAAKVFAAMEVDEDVLAAKIDEVGIDGTTDLTEEEAAARQMELRLEEGEVRIILRDQAAVELAQAVSEQVGGPIRGDDPVAGGLARLHQAVVQFLTDLHRRVTPAPEEPSEAEGSGPASLIQRAIGSRLRRRSR